MDEISQGQGDGKSLSKLKQKGIKNLEVMLLGFISAVTVGGFICTIHRHRFNELV